MAANNYLRLLVKLLGVRPKSIYEDLEGFVEHMKDSHSVKAGPHQKGFDNLPDGLPTITHGFLSR